MKKIIQSLVLIFASAIAYGQEIIVTTDKTEYKIDEIIYLQYEVNANVDSVEALSATNIKLLNGPRKSTSMSSANGQTTFTYQLAYEIKALSPGRIEITSPTFYLNNKKEKAETIILKIVDEKLTEKEIDEIKFNEFKDDFIPSNGTLRFILSDQFGLVEEFYDFKWRFKKRLTKKQMDKLRKL